MAVTERYDLVVGADGVHSSVRRALLGHADPRPAVLTAASWRFVVPAKALGCWTAWLGSDATFLLIPVDTDHVYGYASATRGGRVSSDPGWMTSTFANFPDPPWRVVCGRLPGCDDTVREPVEDLSVTRGIS